MPELLLAVHPAVEGCGSHDPSAALFVDGRLDFGIEEERLVREKHAPGRFPSRSIEACLAHRGLGLGDVDRVLVPWTPPAEALAAIAARFDELGLGTVPPIETYGHHRCHAASAFFPSGFEEALVLTVDGRGTDASTAVWHGRGSDLERLRRYEPPNSLGYLYAAVTGYLGYRIYGGEGRTMALAAYGEGDTRVESRLRSAIDVGDGYDVTPLVGGGVPGGIRRLEELFGPRRTEPADPGDARSTDLAAAVQRVLEGIVREIVETYCDRLATANVCLAGGVALNCKLNGHVAESPVVERLFVQPVAGDAGAPIGAGLLASEGNARMGTIYVGPSFSEGAVVRRLDRRDTAYERPADLLYETARLLADGAIVGWFRGRTEMGPRALGHRSVLADPRSPRTRDRLNAYVKHREAWRPFAPSILAEAADEYVESPRPAPYMIQSFDTRPEARERIPAAVHSADGTVRAQIVRREHAPVFHRLLSTFGDLTGVPVLLNTSFNDHGEPIVNTLREALAAAEGMGLDRLVLGDHLIEP